MSDDIRSINEPNAETVPHSLVSINEPPPPVVEPPPAPRHAHVIDPDDLEDEIEAAEEEDDFRPTHKPKPKKRR